MSNPNEFALGAHDVAALARRYRERGRVRIRNFLADPAPLARHLGERIDWRQVLNAGDKVYELDAETRAQMSLERKADLDAAIYAGATSGFQFRYESIRVPDEPGERAARDDALNRFAAWLSDGEPREMLRTITGTPAIDFADAQATRFSGGDFLTGHDDLVEGKHRHAAYVCGLTPLWRVEWGGLLLFHASGGEELRGLAPEFNVLDVFAVPAEHSVSLVSPAAGEKRVSITGWLRSRS
ncbi:2OG-Fe(II) oxygenase family protein [Sphingomonas sp. TX0543]|uniref:2OG-Fe(II) oxygenase family protein n=1 Tax=unclassified Sphingomonas TaxID=196159 RepID=UPI002016280C|nr:2OG-Fe(II) oxygenase family protein [Sphingomonas sp. 3P27F8]